MDGKKRKRPDHDSGDIQKNPWKPIATVEDLKALIKESTDFTLNLSDLSVQIERFTLDNIKIYGIEVKIYQLLNSNGIYREFLYSNGKTQKDGLREDARTYGPALMNSLTASAREATEIGMTLSRDIGLFFVYLADLDLNECKKYFESLSYVLQWITEGERSPFIGKVLEIMEVVGGGEQQFMGRMVSNPIGLEYVEMLKTLVKEIFVVEILYFMHSDFVASIHPFEIQVKGIEIASKEAFEKLQNYIDECKQRLILVHQNEPFVTGKDCELEHNYFYGVLNTTLATLAKEWVWMDQ